MMHQGWTVLCDAPPYVEGDKQRCCFETDQTSGSKRSAAKDFEISGWRRISDNKWLCPDCAKRALEP
jgi:invasion protein IalB